MTRRSVVDELIDASEAALRELRVEVHKVIDTADSITEEADRDVHPD